MQRKWKRNWRKEALRRVYAGFLAGALLLSGYSTVLAAPQGGAVVAGSAAISQNGATTTINQASQKAIINWNSFGIAKGETVRFDQPGASAIALNRVTGNNASAIYGTLSANGQVFLVNPNGVLFAKGAQVNVGGLAASTLGLADKDFLNGNYQFSGDSVKSVVNQGELSAVAKGYIALLGANAVNEGVIVAKEGTVAVGAGSKVNLDFTGDGLLQLSVDKEAVAALASNKGLIQADGGLVVMSAKSADALAGTVVNNSGVIEAKSVSTKNGVIRLEGNANGTVVNSGSLDASGLGAGETGGTVKVLGDKVSLSGTSVISASGDAGGGTILAGGNYQGSGTEQRATETSVAAGASLQADAATSGNGGTVVVWADGKTTFGGAISAKGGSQSGDGGRVETSGKKTLTLGDTAKVDTTATQGKTGSWLLDPADFTIGAGATGANYWKNTDLKVALSSSNISIITEQNKNIANGTEYDTTSGIGNGDINIIAPVTWDSANTLTLSAYNNINMNAAISGINSNSSLTLISGTGNSAGSISGSGTVDVGSVAVTGNDVTLKASNALKLDSSNVRGNLTITAGGAVTQSGALTVTGDTNIKAVNENITLKNVDNNFIGAVFLTGKAVSLTDVNALMLGYSSVGGDLNITAGGEVTQKEARVEIPALIVGGTTTITAQNGVEKYDITLDQLNNNFQGSVSLSGRAVQIADENALQLGAVTAGENLFITAGGAVTQTTGALKVAGATTVNAGANDITLDNSANDFTSTVSLNGRDVQFIYINALQLGASKVSGNLNITAGGAVTQATGALTVGGTTTVKAISGAEKQDITLTNANNNFGGAMSLNGRNVQITDGNALQLGASDIGGNLNITAGGAVTQTTGALKVAGATRVTAQNGETKQDITLADGQNNFTGEVTLIGKDVKLTDANALILGAVTTPGSLTLSAGGDITADGSISTGIFDLQSGTWKQLGSNLPSFSATDFRISGGTFIRALGGTGVSGSPYQITDVYGLQGVGSTGMLSNCYTLANDIKAVATSGWNGGKGFVPIGKALAGNGFTGSFNGGDHTIADLFIGRQSEDFIGLFGAVFPGAKIYHIGLVQARVSGDSYIGALAGQNLGSITNCYATGSVSGSSNAGGLVGSNYKGSISNCYATGSVKVTSFTAEGGGLVGDNFQGGISNCYATGNVSGTSNFLGGLMGGNNGGTIINSYWDMDTTGRKNSAGGTGLTTAQMKDFQSYTGWNMETIWYLNAGQAAPMLRCFGAPTTPTMPTQVSTAAYTAVLQGVHQPAANSGFGGAGLGGGFVAADFGSGSGGSGAGSASSSAAPASSQQPTGLLEANGAAARSIQASGSSVTLRSNALVEINLDPVHREVAVYRNGTGGTQLLSTYQLDGNHSTLSLRDPSPGAVAPAARAPLAAQHAGALRESTVFQLLTAQGDRAVFSLALQGGQALISATNAVAEGLLAQNQLQTVTAAALAAGQDQLGLDLNTVAEIIVE